MTAMVNSLDLDPEMGAIDLLGDVEGLFGLTFTSAEAEACETMGDLEALVAKHLADWSKGEPVCSSLRTFHRLRKALPELQEAVPCASTWDGSRAANLDAVAMRDHDQPAHSVRPLGQQSRFAPKAKLADLGLNAKCLFKRLGRETGLRMPALHLTWLGMAGCGAALLGLILTFAALEDSLGLPVLLGGAALLLLGLALLRADPCALPQGMESVGDLVARVAALNADRLRAGGARPPEPWTVLTALAAEHGRLAPADIRRDTVFHGSQLRAEPVSASARRSGPDGPETQA